MAQTIKYVTELFYDQETADKAYQVAIDFGYQANDINLIMSEQAKETYYGASTDNKKTDTLQDVVTGSAIGGAIGATFGALTAIGSSMIIPGLGLVVAGPIIGGLAGVGAGTVSGGLIGALVSAGIPAEQAQVYQDEIKSGAIVIGVNAKQEDELKLKNAWRALKSEQATSNQTATNSYESIV